MEVDIPVNALDAGDSGAEGQLVGIGRIHHKAGLAVLPGKAVRQLGAQLGRVLHAVGTARGVVEKDVVHLVGASRKRQQAAAAPDEGVDAGEVHAVLPECGLDEAQAVG